MSGANLTLLVAFGAGLVSFVSPCVLPLVPAYLGHLAGSTVPGTPGASRTRAFSHALAFVVGFSTIFIGFWLLLGLGLYFLSDNLRIIRTVGGIVLVVLGLHTIGLLNISALYRERRLHARPRNRGLGSSFLVGTLFAAGWTPCIGPTLGAIIGLAAYGGDVARGSLLLGAYSAGLGVPFLVSGLALDTATDWLRRARGAMRVSTVISGVFLIAVGILMLSNMWVRIPQYFRWGTI